MSHVSLPVRSPASRVGGVDWRAGALLVALFAAYPFHRLATYGFSFNYSRGDPIVGLILAAWLLGLLGTVVVPRRGWLVGALLGVCTLSVAYGHVVGPDVVSVRTGLVEVLKLAGAIAWGAAVFGAASGRARRVLPVALAVSVVIAVWFAGETVHATIWLGEGRQTGPFHNANIFGNYLLLHAFLAPALAASWLGRRWRGVAVLAVGAVPLLGLGIVLTASRGAMVGAVAGAVALPLLSQRVRWWVVAAGAVAATVFLRQLASAVENRTAFLLGRFLSEKNLGGRWELWELALGAFRDSPVLGIGFGQYRELALRELGRNAGAHSSLLSIAAETGLVGLALFVILLVAVVFAGVDCRGEVPEAAFPAAFVVGTAAHGLVADVHTFRALWLAAGIVAVLHADRFGSALELGAWAPPSTDRAG